MSDRRGRGAEPGFDLGLLAAELDARLGPADAALARDYPGARAGRQPVHTVYVPADRFHAGLVAEFAESARSSLDTHEALLLELLDGDEPLLERVREKLGREPVEDLRIDFEDGYGPRDDAEEDRTARSAAAELRTAIQDHASAPFTGIRFKSFEKPTRDRGLRTLTLFLETLCDGGRAAGRLRGHAAQGHLGRPGGGDGPHRTAAWSPGSAWRPAR